MSNIFQTKRVAVPGLLYGEALDQQMSLLTDQMRLNASTVLTQPALGERPADLLQIPAAPSLPQSRPVSSPTGALGPLPDQPTPQQSQANPAIFNPFAAMVEAGTLTPEQGEAERIQRIEDAQQTQHNTEERLRLREQMRDLSPEDAAAMGFPVAPDAEAFAAEGGPEMLAERDRAIAERVAEATEAAEQAPAPTQTWWLNAVQVGVRSFLQTGTSALRYPAAFWELLTAGEDGPERSEYREFLDNIDAQINTMLPGDKARSRDFLTDLSAGAGSFTAFMLAGYVGRILGAGVGVTAGILGATTTGSTLYVESEEYDATVLQKWVSLIAGSGLGLSEAIPIDRIFGRIDDSTGGGVRRALANSVAGSIEEFFQELGQSIGEDAIAAHIAGYDPDREFDPREWLRSAAVGAVTGAAGGAVTSFIPVPQQATPGQPAQPPTTILDPQVEAEIIERFEASQAVLDTIFDEARAEGVLPVDDTVIVPETGEAVVTVSTPERTDIGIRITRVSDQEVEISATDPSIALPPVRLNADDVRAAQDLAGVLQEQLGIEVSVTPIITESLPARRPAETVELAGVGEVGTVEAMVSPDERAANTPVTETQAFRTWFGDSKVVDADGAPLVVYHGTGAAFTQFDGMAWGSETPALANEYAAMREGLGGTPSVMPLYMRIEAPFNADLGLSKAVTVGEFLNAAIEQAESQGRPASPETLARLSELADTLHEARSREESGPVYSRHDFWNAPELSFGADGAQAIRDTFEILGFDGVQMIENGEVTYGAFDPEQIKSVDNQGTFDPEVPNIFAMEALPPVGQRVAQAIENVEISPEELKPLEGLPKSSTGPIKRVVQAARAYADAAGIPFRRQADYVQADPDRGERIALAYQNMKHEPDDPAVRATFRAMIDETVAQYQFVKASGIIIEAIEPGQPDPYPDGPRQVLEDIENGHLWFFPTDQGFGTLTEAERTNPLLEPTNEFIGDRQLLANDVFRIVHDFFGHGLEGAGFGARGEENAWQAHMRLYSQSALPAVTTETRGQNSWVNFGPYGEQNRQDPRNTVYADQKTGLMPSWTWQEGVADHAEFQPAAQNNLPIDPEDTEISAMVGTATTRAPYPAEQTRPAEGVPEQAGQKAEVSLRRIATSLRTLLDLTVRQGRLTLRGSQVMGQYDRRTATIRVRNVNDLSTLVHEAGHAINDAKSKTLDTFVNQHGVAFIDIAHKLYAGDLSKAPTETILREGFAEFFRVYTLNRAYLETNYPDLVRDFSDMLERTDPRIKTGLDAIGQQYQEWLQLPSAQLLRNMVVDGTRQRGINAAIKELRDHGFKSWFSELTRRAVQTTVNRYVPLNRVVADLLNVGEANTGAPIDLARADDPRVLARLARNSSSRAMVEVRDGVVPYRGVNPVTRGLREALMISQGVDPSTNPSHIDEERSADFDAYLVALRARDEYRRYSEGLIARPPISASLGDVNQAIADYEARYGDSFIEAAVIVNEFGQALWRKQYEAGLTSKETYEEGLSRQFYAPLQRDMSDKKAQFGASAITAGAARGGSTVRQFRGSDRDIVSPMSVLMQKTFALEAMIAENEVKKALAVLADRAGQAGALVERVPARQVIGQQYSVREVAQKLTQDDSLTELDAADLMIILGASIADGSTINLFRSEQASAAGENIMFFWENGKLAAIQLKDGDVGKDLIDALQGLGRENMWLPVKMVAATSTAFRAATTSWPDFLLVNYVRDQMQAWMLTEGFTPFVSGAKGMYEELRQRDWARLYNLSGGIMGGMNVAALHEARVDQDLNALRSRGYIATVFHKKGPLGVLEGFSRLTELSETGTRLGVFRATYERAKADGLTDYEALIEAGYTATDIADFGLNGGDATALFRRTIPFLNAQLQGLYKMLRTMGGDEVAQRRGLRFALTAFLKNENQLPLSRTERMAVRQGRKLWIKMGVISLFSAALAFLFWDDPDYQEASEYLRTTGWVIPMGEGRIFYIPKPFELALMANATERGIEAATGDPTAKARFMRGLIMSLAPPTAPPLITAAIEQATNKSFFTGGEIVPGYMQSLPADLQYDNYTSEIAKMVGGLTGMSPMLVDHWLESLGSSAYRDITTLTDQLSGTRPSLSATELPILRRFVRDARRGSTTMQDFWDQASTLDGSLRTAERGYKVYLERGNEAAANDYLQGLTADEQGYALLMTHFDTDAKRLNPYYRARQVTSIVSGMRREMGSEFGIEDTSPYALDSILMTPGEKRKMDQILSEIARREVRNTLIATQAPGWADRDILPLEPTLNLLEQTNPMVAEEYRRRLEKTKVYAADVVFEYWPEVRDRVLMDREFAYLSDLVAIAKVLR